VAHSMFDVLTVEQVMSAYRTMEKIVGSAQYSQDQAGLLSAVVAHVPDADCASLTEHRDGVYRTLSASSDLAWEADELQFKIGSGPCLDAIVEHEVLASIDIGSDGRWPEFGALVSQTLGIQSMISLRLLSDIPDSSYALNVYAQRRDAFDDRDLVFCLMVGSHASSMVRSSQTHERILNLERALETNREIATAVGIVMATHKLPAASGFELIRLMSMNSNRKLRDIAADIVLTGVVDLPKSNGLPLSGSPTAQARRR
jgi:ANTAR domain